MNKLKEHLCKKISDTITKLSRDGKIIRRTNNDVGVFIHDSNRSQLIKSLADKILEDREILDGVNIFDLERLIFDGLRISQNRISMQERAQIISNIILQSYEKE